MLTSLAPAKINLVLEVLGKRGDGYHEIRSLIQTISLCDTIFFELADNISLECTKQSLQIADNLIVQAAELLGQVCGCKDGAKIRLEKRIPWGAGLGGGSSDAATTLLALNELWGLKLETTNLVELAAKLGSDVPFFIYKGAALIEGRGERITPLTASLPNWFVLLLPPLPKIPHKTQQLYTQLGSNHFTNGRFVEKALNAWSQKKQISPSMLFNVFDKVAFDTFPGLEGYWESFKRTGALDIHLAGSGPALFAPVDSEAWADELCHCLYHQGFESYSVYAISAEAANRSE